MLASERRPKANYRDQTMHRPNKERHPGDNLRYITFQEYLEHLPWSLCRCIKQCDFLFHLSIKRKAKIHEQNNITLCCTSVSLIYFTDLILYKLYVSYNITVLLGKNPDTTQLYRPGFRQFIKYKGASSLGSFVFYL